MRGWSNLSEQRRRKEAPYPAVDAEILIKEHPVVAILTGRRHTRGDRPWVDVHHIIASRVASDLLGPQMMNIVGSTASVLDPCRNLFAAVPMLMRVSVGWRQGEPGIQRSCKTEHGCCGPESMFER